MPIGVFDSGIGGLSVLQALREELPGEDFVYLADNGFAPYGEQGDALVTARTHAIAQYLHVQHHIKALVIACNTATAAAILQVRACFPALPVIGVEPALKPAIALSATGHIGVMATRGTVNSVKFQTLLADLQGSARFVVQPCDGLAAAIERHALHPNASNATELRALCQRYTRAMGQFGSEKGQIDTLVLGCTHYVFAAPALRELLGDKVQLIDNGAAVARQTRRLLTVAEALATQATGQTTLLTTRAASALQAAATQWLGLEGGAATAVGASVVDVPH